MLDSQVWKAAAIGALAVATSVGALHLFGTDSESNLGGPSMEWFTASAPQEPSRRLDRTPVESPAAPATATPTVAVAAEALRGRVVDHRGTPVADANVRVWNRIFYGTDRYRDGARAQTPTEAVTNADGEFVAAGRSPTQKWGLSAQAPGFAVTTAVYKPDEREDIVLYPSTSLTGTVRDAVSGQAIEGTLVRYFDLSFDGQRLDLVRTATTDKRGAYRLDGLPAARRIQVEFAAPGVLSVYQTLNLDAAESNSLELALDRSPQIEVLVRDVASLLPVAGAVVHATGRGSRPLGTTGSDGRLRVTIPKIASGSSPAQLDDAVPGVFVEAPGYGRTRHRVTISKGELDARLVPAGRLRGIVRDVATGAALSGAEVSWVSPPMQFVEPSAWGGVAGDSVEATTNENGEFILPRVPPAERVVEGELQVWHNGRVAYVHGVLPAAAGEERLLEIDIGANRTVRGRVLVSGSPSTGWVSLAAEGDGLDGTRRESSATNADGYFEFANLKPGRYRLTARAVDATAEAVVDLGDSNVDDVELNVAVAAGHIHGTVLTDEGLPSAGSAVLAFMMHENGREVGEHETIETPDDFVLESSEMSSGGAGFARIDAVATADENGHFDLVLPANPKARYRLGVYQGAFGVVVHEVPQGAHGIEFRVPRLVKVRFALSDQKTGEPVRRAGIKWSHAATGRDVTLAWKRAWDTMGGVLTVELPIGSVQLTLRDQDRKVVRELTVEVPENGLPDAIPVVF